MKIAIGQINSKIGDFDKNASLILQESIKAYEAGVKLIVFPEMSISGYPPMDLVNYDSFVDKNIKALEWLISNLTFDIHVCVGYVDYNQKKHGKRLVNRAVIINKCKIVYSQDKTLLPTYDVFDEARYFEPGTERSYFEIEGTRIGLAICEDIWWNHGEFSDKEYPENPVDEILSYNPNIIIVPSASPFYSGKTITRLEIAKDITHKGKCLCVYANMVGANDNLIFDGNSFVVNENSDVIAVAEGFKSELLIFDTVDTKSLPDPAYHKYEEIESALALGISEYLRKCGLSRVVIGSSGGIDSALVAYLAVKALGKENVRTFSMPSRYSSNGSKTDAQELARNLDIPCDELVIEPMFESFLTTLDPFFNGTEMNVAEENIQARIRGTLLMAYSNKFGSMVLTTGNKSELATGYCTLYGDMAGGLSVIGDLFKTEVFELCYYINREKEIIPINILEKPPSAELRPDQKDEDSLPPYDVLDSILELYIVQNKSLDDIVKEDFDRETVEFVLKLTARSEFKRNQTPPVLKVSKKAFGNGRRIPIARTLTEV
ncbi:MAG: NAD+ synthase [Spirochaetales bacterium]|nr:NAD+ synthase [Spirochaetales bacterium]